MTGATLFDRGAAPRPSDCWSTPAGVLAAARAAVGGAFDLDPCSSEAAQRRVQAARWIGPPADGLAADWRCARLWMNPPFSARAAWMAKLAAASASGAVDAWAALIPDPTTLASQPLVEEADVFAIPAGRIHFERPAGAPSASGGSNTPTYLFAGGRGLDADGAARAFRRIGTAWSAVRWR